MRTATLSLIILLTTTCVRLPALGAQESIIAQMLLAQDSLVTVQALNQDIYQQSPAGLAVDPATGRMVLVRNLAQATYQREGAGVIVHRSGIIVTNAHVINQANRVNVILKDKTLVPAQVVRFVNNVDMALLQITPPYPLTALPIADSNDIKLGDEIVTVGHSDLLHQTVSGGRVIGLGRNRTSWQQGETRNDLIQTTINLYQGDSGGPLFDRKGRLVGLMTAKEMGADHSSFAIPSNQIVSFLIDYLNETKSKK